MRIIPKKSKVNTTIWKNFTILDLLIIFVCFLVILLFIGSDLKFKWLCLAIVVPIMICLMFENDGVRFYSDIIYICKYIIQPKHYGISDSSDSKRKHKKNTIENITPQNGIDGDGFILYDGYFASVLELGSVEFRLYNEFTQNMKISQFAKVFNCLTEDQSAQIVKIDRPINFDVMAEKIYKKIAVAEAEPQKDFAKIAILKSQLEQIDNLNNIEVQYRPYYYLVVYEEDKETLFNVMNYISNCFAEMELPTTKLDAKEIAVFLKYCYTRDFDEREVENFNQDNYMDFIKPKNVKFTSWGAEVDGLSTFTYAIADYPLTVANAWGSELFNLNNTKVVLNIKPINKERAIKQIDKTVVEIGTKDDNNKASQALEQGTHLETMGSLLASLQNENEALFDCTLTVTGFFNPKNEEKKDSFRKQIKRSITTNGFRVNVLRCRQFDGFISSNITRRNRLKNLARSINSESLSAVFPFVFTSILEDDGVLLGCNQYPVILDIWKRAKNYVNSNMFVVGRPGAGKSYFAGTLNSLLYSDGCQIYIFDPENEYNYLARNLGGTIIDVGNAVTGRLNPFQIYQVLTDDGENANAEVTFQAHLRMLESFFKITLPGITSDSLEELNNLIVKCYEKRGINQNVDCSNFKPEDFPIFDDLLKIIDFELDNLKSPLKIANLERVRTYVTKFATGGRYSNLWNGAATLEANSKLVVFNFQSLFESKNIPVVNGQMLLVLKFLDQQIINIRERNRNSNSLKHTFIAVDEGYNFIDVNYPIALDFIFQKYKRIRKYGGSICFLTQNLNDLIGNKDIIAKTSAIINNSQYSFIFGLAPNDIDILTELYANAGEINETEQYEIANATMGQCFLISSPRERTSFQVVANDMVEMTFQTEITAEEMNKLNA